MSLHLNEDEATALAWRIATRQVDATGQWLEWEDYPNLDEASFDRLDAAVHVVAASMRLSTHFWAQARNVDAAHLEEMAR